MNCNCSDWKSFGNSLGYFRYVQDKIPYIEIVSRDKSLPIPMGYRQQVHFVKEEKISRKWGTFDISYIEYSYRVYL